MDIWKVSKRAILIIQRIVRMSPEPRFVSSVSWHRASPQALTPRWLWPKHDTDDGQRKRTGDRGGLRQYDAKAVSTPLSDFNSFRQALWWSWWRRDRCFWSR